jgi:hypothetical protein
MQRSVSGKQFGSRCAVVNRACCAARDNVFFRLLAHTGARCWIGVWDAAARCTTGMMTKPNLEAAGLLVVASQFDIALLAASIYITLDAVEFAEE